MNNPDTPVTLPPDKEVEVDTGTEKEEINLDPYRKEEEQPPEK